MQEQEPLPTPVNDSAAIGASEGQPAAATSRALAPAGQLKQMEDHGVPVHDRAPEPAAAASRSRGRIDPVSDPIGWYRDVIADIERRVATLEALRAKEKKS